MFAMASVDQLALFDTAPALPDGLRYQAGFIAPQEEAALIAAIRQLPLQPFQFGAFEGKRRVAWFGWRYDYTLQRMTAATPIPDWLAPLRVRAAAFIGRPAEHIQQALVTEYDEGVGIGWHKDKPHFETIIGISLGSDCTFRLRRKAGPSWQRAKLVAEARSIYTMDGSARHEWEHSIPGVDAPRYSVTFRTMKA